MSVETLVVSVFIKPIFLSLETILSIVLGFIPIKEDNLSQPEAQIKPLEQQTTTTNIITPETQKTNLTDQENKELNVEKLSNSTLPSLV